MLHGGALGDLALSVMFALRSGLIAPADHVRLIGRADLGNLRGCQPMIERFAADGLPLHWLYAEPDASEGPDAPQRLAELIRGARVINLLTGPESAAHARLLGLGPASVVSIDPRPIAASALHITAQWERAIHAQDAAPSQCVVKRRARALNLNPELRAIGARRFRDAGVGTPPLLIHPGSGGAAKCWPLTAYVAVGQRLRAAGADITTAFIIGPVERESWSAAKIQELADAFPLIRCDSAEALTEFLAAARLLVSNDAGPAHLAALLGTPTLTLFGPTDARVWRPLGPRAQTLIGDADQPAWGLTAAAVAERVLPLLA